MIKNQIPTPTNEQWDAIFNNDKQQDGKFWYGVTTTQIFCRPSCPSRLPKRDHVVVFNNPQQALDNGFRPCKRCRPLDKVVTNQVWVQEIEHVLQTYYAQKITLDKLASLVHGDPSYLRHTYKAITGITPQQRLQQIRLSKAQQLLKSSNEPIAKISNQVGIPNTAYFISLFKRKYGQTPLQYRNI